MWSHCALRVTWHDKILDLSWTQLCWPRASLNVLCQFGITVQQRCRVTWHEKILDLFLDTALLARGSDPASIRDLGALLQPLAQAASACRPAVPSPATLQRVRHPSCHQQLDCEHVMSPNMKTERSAAAHCPGSVRLQACNAQPCNAAEGTPSPMPPSARLRACQ